MLSKMVPIRIIGMIFIPLLIFFMIPSSIIGVIAKVILIIWVLIVIKSSFSDMWAEYENLGAFTVLNTLWFVLLLWLSNPFWLKYVFIFLIVTGFGTMFKHINEKSIK